MGSAPKTVDFDIKVMLQRVRFEAATDSGPKTYYFKIKVERKTNMEYGSLHKILLLTGTEFKS